MDNNIINDKEVDVNSSEGSNDDARSSDDQQNNTDSDSESKDEDENATQTIIDMGRHERMQRIQKVLFDQLTGNDKKISTDLREKEEELRRIKKQREDVGVVLYGVQQQLAQLQMNLEASHSKVNEYREERFGAEDRLDDWRENVKQKKEHVVQRRNHLYKTQADLDALNTTLRQVEEFNVELKNEIYRTQRAAHKAEETMANIEKVKVKQDLYIDSLNEQIKSLQHQIQLYVDQLKRQKDETASAADTVTEAAKQMDTISFEKKQLLQQWKSSVVNLQQRDQALQSTQEAIRNVKEQDVVSAAEIRGYNISVEAAQREHETLTATIERFNAKIRFVEEQTLTIQEEHDRLSERYELLTKSLKQTESQSAKTAAEGKKLDGQVTQIQVHLETAQRERHALEDQISVQKNTQTTVNKAAHNLSKEAQKLQESMHEKEIALASLQNDIARMNVDVLNLQAHIDHLKESHLKCLQHLKEDDLKAERIELEIRQRNDEIEKKMLRLDRLNKKYEQLISKLEDENTGPLEATVKMLTKEVEETQNRNAEKQKSWLLIQTSLMQLCSDSQDLNDNNQYLKSKNSVLKQKYLRLQSNVSALQKEIKDLKSAVQAMHNDTIKINELIAKQSHRQDELESMNHNLELEFKHELQELEAEAIQLEARAGQLKLEKQVLLDKIIEVERQALLWEKKIQLEKETQAALDPQLGQAESKSMEKEIHRMKNKYEALQRSEEQLLQDMEQAIKKRDIIAMRGQSKKDSELTYASLTTKVSTLQNNLRKTDKQVAQTDKQIQQKSLQCEDLSLQIEQLTAQLKEEEERGMVLQRDINNALYDKQRLIDADARKRRLLKRFEALKRMPTSGTTDDNNTITRAQEDCKRSYAQVEIVKEIITTLQGENPHLVEILARVKLLSEEPALQ